MNVQHYIKNYIRHKPINSLLIGINTVFLFVTLFSGGFDLVNLVNLGALFPPLVTENSEYFRLITAMFLHANIFHFLMNMYVLYYLGGHMEQLIGPRKYLLAYMASGIVSSLAVTYLGSDNVVTVGASGAIFGIMGGLLLLTFVRKEWFSPQTIRSIRNLMGLNLVLTFVIADISILGHLGGLITGLLLFYFIAPEKPYYYDIHN